MSAIAGCLSQAHSLSYFPQSRSRYEQNTCCNDRIHPWHVNVMWQAVTRDYFWIWRQQFLHLTMIEGHLACRTATRRYEKPSLQHDTNREIQTVCVRMTEYVRFSRGTPFQVPYSFSTTRCWLHIYNHHKNSRKTWTKIFTHYNNSNAFIFFYLFIQIEKKLFKSSK